MKINWFGTKVSRTVKIHPWGSYSKQFTQVGLKKNAPHCYGYLLLYISLILHTSYHVYNPKELLVMILTA